MKPIPVGIQDFKSVRNKGYYFVDKSMLIGQILDQFPEDGVFLYTRPRRFGKSLNLSMLDAFFNLEYKGNTWFDGLEISKHPEYDCYKNAFPVISISLKLGNPRNFEYFIELFNVMLKKTFKKFTYLRDSPEIDKDTKKDFNRYYSGKKTVVDSMIALSDLCSMLESHHKSKVIVLIDEYDGTVNDVTDKELRREIVSFLGDVLSPLLKEGTSRQLGVVTGITQITKENIFSGVNNFTRNDIFDVEYDEMFGFTNEEVKQICADYGHPEKFEEAKEWYDGYRFGDADIYNPWSILNYVQKNFKPETYWVNTSGNEAIYKMLLEADSELTDNLKILGAGGTVSEEVSRTLTFDDLEDIGKVYSLMALAGYLKAIPKGQLYELSIPNRELFFVFSEMLNRVAFKGGSSSKLLSFTDAIKVNDVAAMKDALYELIVMLSSRVLNDEHSYQAFITGMLMNLCGSYEIRADFENGDGYYDIMMTKRKGDSPNIVIELKRSENDGHLENDAKAVLQQIKDRDYAHGLEGKIILYGIAFSGKKPFIISEEI